MNQTAVQLESSSYRRGRKEGPVLKNRGDESFVYFPSLKEILGMLLIAPHTTVHVNTKHTNTHFPDFSSPGLYSLVCGPYQPPKLLKSRSILTFPLAFLQVPPLLSSPSVRALFVSLSFCPSCGSLSINHPDPPV